MGYSCRGHRSYPSTYNHSNWQKGQRTTIIALKHDSHRPLPDASASCGTSATSQTHKLSGISRTFGLALTQQTSFYSSSWAKSAPLPSYPPPPSAFFGGGRPVTPTSSPSEIATRSLLSFENGRMGSLTPQEDPPLFLPYFENTFEVGVPEGMGFVGRRVQAVIGQHDDPEDLALALRSGGVFV